MMVFVSQFKAAVEKLKLGDPLDNDTQIGSLARVDLAEELEIQVGKTIAMGAQLSFGWKKK